MHLSFQKLFIPKCVCVTTSTWPVEDVWQCSYLLDRDSFTHIQSVVLTLWVWYYKQLKLYVSILDYLENNIGFWETMWGYYAVRVCWSSSVVYSESGRFQLLLMFCKYNTDCDDLLKNGSEEICFQANQKWGKRCCENFYHFGFSQGCQWE